MCDTERYPFYEELLVGCLKKNHQDPPWEKWAVSVLKEILFPKRFIFNILKLLLTKSDEEKDAFGGTPSSLTF